MDRSDEELMMLVSKGNRNAFELLYERYFDKLVWFAGRFVNDKKKAEDAVQEVFVKIIEKPERFDKERRFSTWVYTVTGNECKNMNRNEQNRNKLLEENPDIINVIHSGDLDLPFLQKCLRNAFKELNDKEKNIYVLRFEQELSIKEIAEIMNIPLGSVKSGIYYMLKKISHYLKDFKYEK